MTQRCLAGLLALVCVGASDVLAQKQFGFVNTQSSGQPYLTPEESLARMHVAPGYEVKLFAAEPDIINPISFSIDERGRLWVVECYEYPKRTSKGQKPRDRIKILEDTTGSGRADKVTVWAEGKDMPTFDLASGIEVGHGGVFLGAAPYLFFLRDVSGSGHCDTCEILLRGFGSQDTHEVLNTMQWGPEGLLYGLEGIFTRSKVDGVKLDAAVWRYDVPKKKFDIFAEGTSNPWGLDFDKHGQAFLTACVIPHAFHMIPGGTYIRQAGGSLNPYAYSLLPDICDHLHHAESGWAHAGALVLQGNHVPPEYQNSLLMGSIHGCSIKRDVLRANGSTFIAGHAPDFLVSGDKNFRPINMRWGPDGAIYVIDWHDQNPCHQALPDSWDMTHGRIYKIQRKGARTEPRVDLSQKSSAELVGLLENDNPWCYRTATRLLAERRDQSVVPLLENMARKAKDDSQVLRAYWALYGMGAWNESTAGWMLNHESPWVRAWGVRLLGEPGRVSEGMRHRFWQLAQLYEAPQVRLQLACTAQRLVSQDTVPMLQQLMSWRNDAGDPFIPRMIWLAYEPKLAARPDLSWLAEHTTSNPLIREQILPWAFRRLATRSSPDDVQRCAETLERLSWSPARRLALEGILEGLRGTEPPEAWRRVVLSCMRDSEPDVVRLGLHLAAKFHDEQALALALAVAVNTNQPLFVRIEAVRDLAESHPRKALAPLEKLMTRETNPELRVEICRCLAAYDDPEIARHILAAWKGYPSSLQTEVINLLAGRKEWARVLLAALERKELSRSDLSNNVILRIQALGDRELNAKVQSTWGRVRETTPAELSALINRMRQELSTGNGGVFERGRKVFEDQCAKCHRFEGKGYDVGPNLDGAARDIESLLVNILDPNRVVGRPYFAHFITLKDGRVEAGLLVRDDAESVTLKAENGAVKVLLRKNIEDIAVHEKSLMPEGLDKLMTVQNFRDLIRYLMANPFLTNVRLAGPMPPSRSVAIDPKQPVRNRELGWSEPAVGLPGRIGLPRPGGGQAVAFVAADITAPEAMQTSLLVGCGSSMQIWLNGAKAFQGKPGEDVPAPDQRAIDLRLQQGANVLLFRITYHNPNEALYARLLDPQRRLR